MTNSVEPSTAPERTIESGAELMLRFRGGDGAAFDELVGRYQRTIVNTVYRYLGNQAVAEEVAQEVFVRIFRAATTYESKAKFETWLHRIIFNLCANKAEYGKRRKALSIDRDASGPEDRRFDVVAHDAGAAEVMIEEETASAVRTAIDRLPAQQRAALLLSRYESMPYQEIATTLDVSLEAVKSLLFRARENLREYLAPYLREEVRDEL